jgi:predicted RNA-binding Zn-ribbon protein involved in translation (DUF1610 family)
MGLLDRLLGRDRKPELVADEPAPGMADFDAERRRAEAAGSFDGKHFTEWAPEVDRLRKEGQFEESLVLAYRCIDATEAQHAVDGNGVAPGYYWDAAVALRSLHRYAEEAQVLERYLALAGGRNPNFEDRLRKTVELRDAEVNATAPACPACGTVLDSPPKSRGKCPSCGQSLVMRTVAGQRVAFTPEQATAQAEADKASKRRAKFLKRLGYFDVTEQDWDAVYAEQTERFGRPSADGDVYWQLATDAAVRYEQSGQWIAAAQVRDDMAKFNVEEGRDWVGSARLAEQDTMRALQEYDGPDQAMILIACPCDVCQQAHLQVKPFRDFTAAWPLPHEDCRRPPCRCRIQRQMS